MRTEDLKRVFEKRMFDVPCNSSLRWLSMMPDARTAWLECPVGAWLAWLLYILRVIGPDEYIDMTRTFPFDTDGELLVEEYLVGDWADQQEQAVQIRKKYPWSRVKKAFKATLAETEEQR